MRRISAVTALRVGFASLLAASLLAGTFLAAAPLAASEVDVRLRLPMRARLDLTDRESLLPVPFIIITQEGEARLGSDFDVLAEFRRYLLKILRRDTKLKIIEGGPIDYPTYDLELLSRDEDFWRMIGERNQADLVLTGSIDFDVQDRSGYRTEEYTSPFDGRTYYRQVLVEQTGFEFDILVFVFDGKTGELLHSDNFKDFKRFDAEDADIMQGMFSNLYALEDRLLGIFIQKQIEVSRTLFQ